MYSVSDYGSMIADDVRTGAYARALRCAVGPQTVVLDIGAGTGIMSFLACQCGAHKVYAVEPNDAILVAAQIARDIGVADRIEFIQAASTDVDLPERVDVIVSDLRGNLPQFQLHFPVIIDARNRLLAPGGVLIPKRDVVWASVIEAPADHERLVKPWTGNSYGLRMDAALNTVTNTLVRYTAARHQILADPACWGEFDYSTVASPNHATVLDLTIGREGVGHGLLLWFDAVLADGVGFSNAPGEPKLVYWSQFFPWPAAVPLAKGDRVSVHLRADLNGSSYVWGWASTIHSTPVRPLEINFRQSTFWDAPIAKGRLARRAAAYRPWLSEAGRIDREILRRMDGATSVHDIARAIFSAHPGHFPSLGQALARVGELSSRYSADQSPAWVADPAEPD